LINEKINFGLGAAIASFLFFFLIGYLSKYFSKFAENDKVWKTINTFIIIFMSLLTILIFLDTFIS
jgi:L-lysine exporter family protein LysE/ArgO